MSHRVILTEGGGDDAFFIVLLKVCGLDKEFTVYKRVQTKEEKEQNLPPLAGKDSFERYLRAIRTGTETTDGVPIDVTVVVVVADCDEDPDRLLLTPDDRSDLICLKFYDGESLYSSIIEPTTPDPCSFQPPMNRIPGDSLDSSNGRLIEAFDTKGGDFIKRGATVLESIIRCPFCRAECLFTSLTLVATTLSPPGRVKAVANDGSDVTFSRGRAVLVGTAETLHGWWTL